MLIPAHWLRLIRIPILTKGRRNSLLKMVLITLLSPPSSFSRFFSTISCSSFSTLYSLPLNLNRLLFASSSLSMGCQLTDFQVCVRDRQPTSPSPPASRATQEQQQWRDQEAAPMQAGCKQPSAKTPPSDQPG